MALTSLVVCADAKAVQVLTRILREMGIRPEHCGDPHEAAARLGSKHFDVLLVDCADEAPALALIANTKANAATQDILAIAIVDANNNVREAFAKGANFALYRPVSAERAGSSLRAARSLMPGERRRKPRVAARGPVSLSHAAGENIPAKLLDLSEDGVAIHSERALPPSCKIYFEFKLPDQYSTLRLSGDVVWQDFMGRVGLSFSRVPQSSRQLLDGWLRENLFLQLQAGAVPAELGSPAPPAAKASETSVSSDERRIQSRLACQFGAEVYPLGSKVPQRCTLSDIGPGGCYVETTEALPANTAVEIVVRTHDLKLRLRGKVRSTHRGYGMGVEFDQKTREDREEVKRLIAAQTADPEVSIE